MKNEFLIKTILQLIDHIDNLHDEIKYLRGETREDFSSVSNSLENLSQFFYPVVSRDSKYINNSGLYDLKFELKEYLDK